MRKLVMTVFVACFIFLSSSTGLAGRTQYGNIASPECPCGVPGPPTCYDQDTWQLCSGDGQVGGRTASAPPETKSDATSSIGMLLFTAFLILRRII